MFRRIRRPLSVVGLFGLLFMGLFFAAADDPTTNIVITCPETVRAGQTIFGNASEFTPAIRFYAVSACGNPLNLQTSNPLASGPLYFAVPTTEPMAGDVVVFTAHDSKGQTGAAACIVTP